LIGNLESIEVAAGTKERELSENEQGRELNAMLYCKVSFQCHRKVLPDQNITQTLLETKKNPRRSRKIIKAQTLCGKASQSTLLLTQKQQ
jgi:hypothetical protein